MYHGFMETQRALFFFLLYSEYVTLYMTPSLYMWLKDSNCEPVIEVPTWLKSAKIFNWIFPRPSASSLSLSMHLLFQMLFMCVCMGAEVCLCWYTHVCTGRCWHVCAGTWWPEINLMCLFSYLPFGGRISHWDSGLITFRFSWLVRVSQGSFCLGDEITMWTIYTSILLIDCSGGSPVFRAAQWALYWLRHLPSFRIFVLKVLCAYHELFEQSLPPPSLPEPLPDFNSQFKCIVIFSTTPKLYHVAPSCSCLL